jgi:hypothetical protein
MSLSTEINKTDINERKSARPFATGIIHNITLVLMEVPVLAAALF